MKYIISLFLFSITFITHSQTNWKTLMGSPNATFSEIQAAFYAEFGDSVGPKGSGWKQFKRWEYFQSLRLDQNGNMQTANQLWQAVQEHEQKKLAKSYSTGSGNWEEVGPIQTPTSSSSSKGIGRINTIAFHPTDNQTIYAGAASGGFWKSTDKGLTWAKSVDGLTRLGVSSIVIDPNNSSKIFIGTGDRDAYDVPGYGVWKSTNGGATWTSSNSGMGNVIISEVLMHPTNSNILIAAGNQRIYRSTNGGSSWTQVFVNTNVKDIAFHPTNPNIVYAAGKKIYKSTDNGVSFNQLTSGLPSTTVDRFALAVSANQPNWLYVIAGNGDGLIGIFRSTDSGTNFSTRATTPNVLGGSTDGSDDRSQAWYDLVIAADPNNANTIYTGGINIWKSTDGGSTMSSVSHWYGANGIPYVHADQHFLAFSPHTGELFNGNDGGVNYTSDEGLTWESVYDGLAVSQIYKISISQTIPEFAVTGFQDNGTSITLNRNWTKATGGDGMECIIDPLDHNFVYTSYQRGKINRSRNSGVLFQGITDDITDEDGPWVTPYKLDPNNTNTMYLGYENVWRNTDVKNSENWTKISNFTGTDKMRDIAIAPSNSNVVYVSRNSLGEEFFKTTDASSTTPTWTNLSSNLPFNQAPKDIEVDPTNPNHLFIALGNKIYESTNGGSTWTNYSGSLPNISLNTIVIDHDSPVKAMYVGMDVGIYYRDNTSNNWTPYDSGVPNVEVMELEIYSNPNECKSKIYAGTYGRGLWISDLKDPGNLEPEACFTSNENGGCGSVKLTDLSDFTPTSWTWNITPNTFSFINSTDANSQHPEVVFNQTGNYTIELTASNTTGSDSESKSINFVSETVANASTFGENFESYSNCSTIENCGTTSCSINGKWSNLQNGSDDDIDWRIHNGETTTSNTGPSTDYSEETATGKYAYTESSNCSNKTAMLESNCFFIDKNYKFNLGYHLNGQNSGEISIDIFSQGNWIQGIASISGNQGNTWKVLEVPLTDYTDQIVKLRIRGTTGNGSESDMAIDLISFEEISTNGLNKFASSNNQISVYPNPANSSIQVINENINTKNVMVQNTLGQFVLVNTNTTSKNEISINISHLTNGIYYLVVTSNDGEKMMKKFVKN